MSAFFHRGAAAAVAIVSALGSSAAFGQRFSLEGAVIDSRNSQSLGVISEQGDINALFRAQKTMTFGILRAAGITLEQLPPDVRARIERFQTTNLEAFRAYSQGLDLKDQGKYTEAREAFRRAAELDPAFALAAEQRQAMPDFGVGATLTTRAVVLAAAAAQAIDRGRGGVVVDAQRAAAAMASGVTVAIGQTPVESQQNLLALQYSVNEPGATGQAVPGLAGAITYNVPTFTGSFNLALAGEYLNAGEYRISTSGPGSTVLEAIGNLDSKGFRAERGSAPLTASGSAVLDTATGLTAYWGTWNSSTGASATLTLPGNPPVALVSPDLLPIHYVIGEATRVMPATGTASFTPAGGPVMNNVVGRVDVDFLNRTVNVRDLGFSVTVNPNLTQNFSGLNGSTSYAASSTAGVFLGAYSSGACTGCSAFSAADSSFGGSFIGRNANGLAFSTILITGAAESAAGVHLFRRTP